jgi:elongator complex protein 3
MGHRTNPQTGHGRMILVFYNRPTPCGGSCRFCIREQGFTKSTVRNEDTLLARNCGWDPTCQIDARFRQYGLRRGGGHKFGLAVKGDSFTNHDKDYMRSYFQALYDYLNGEPSSSLHEAREKQRSGPDRCVWVQAETRPDQISEEWCQTMLELGVSAVELGVQSLDEDVLMANRRGHGTDEVKSATRLLREYGFDVGYHMMTGLPATTEEIDYDVLAHQLWTPEYSPDSLKIYPCILMQNHQLQPLLARMLATGAWQPISDERYRELLRKVFPHVPRTVLVNRIQRLMPPESVHAGPNQFIDRHEFDGISQCLWQRAAPRALRPADDLASYTVSAVPHAGGYCVEATVRGGDVVLGFGRLQVSRLGVATIRDLRVLGDAVPVGLPNAVPTSAGAAVKLQHLGIGKAILAEMMRLAMAGGCSVIQVHPPTGSAAYFEQVGFRVHGEHYLARHLAPAAARTGGCVASQPCRVAGTLR